ncbi:MAG TPA: winged helix-turn-helix transcriptional regulator [Euryarchaeota archaeon]|nr:winged helix-turn-helix transcriptional regulator [Euryarchaeota archaeon]
MSEVLDLRSYHILRKNISFSQLLLISISLASALSIVSFLIGPFYGESHGMIQAGHNDAISHWFFRLAFPLFTLLVASILLFNIRKREIANIQPIEAVSKVLLPDEQKIVRILKEKGGRATQKELARKTGLNRVKIHRNVHRLAEKNIVTVEPAGNTNTITLTEWLWKGDNGG